MAKTPEQILAQHKKHEERSKNGIEIAKVTSNPELAAFNIRQTFKACMMQGLIGWRCGILSPVSPFQEAIRILRQSDTILNLIVAGRTSTAKSDLPLERASFLEILVDEPPIPCGLDGLVADRLLDGILGHGLQGGWDEEKWNFGFEQLRKIKGTSLACETYTTYRQLLIPSSDIDMRATVEMAVSLFGMRKGNGFFAGGEQTEGGGLDNSITVDYRLSAILKKVGFAFESIHSWKW